MNGLVPQEATSEKRGVSPRVLRFDELITSARTARHKEFHSLDHDFKHLMQAASTAEWHGSESFGDCFCSYPKGHPAGKIALEWKSWIPLGEVAIDYDREGLLLDRNAPQYRAKVEIDIEHFPLRKRTVLCVPSLSQALLSIADGTSKPNSSSALVALRKGIEEVRQDIRELGRYSRDALYVGTLHYAEGVTEASFIVGGFYCTLREPAKTIEQRRRDSGLEAHLLRIFAMFEGQDLQLNIKGDFSKISEFMCRQ